MLSFYPFTNFYTPLLFILDPKLPNPIHTRQTNRQITFRSKGRGSCTRVDDCSWRCNAPATEERLVPESALPKSPLWSQKVLSTCLLWNKVYNPHTYYGPKCTVHIITVKQSVQSTSVLVRRLDVKAPFCA